MLIAYVLYTEYLYRHWSQHVFDAVVFIYCLHGTRRLDGGLAKGML